MRKLISMAVIALALTGCQSAQIETRDALLRQVRDNLRDKIQPKWEAYLEADPRTPLLKEVDALLVEETAKSIEDVVGVKAQDAPAAGGGE